MPRVRLPRASSQAYRQFKRQDEEERQEQTDVAEAPAEAQQPEQPAPEQQEVAADGQAGGQAAQLAEALNELKARDAGGVLEGGTGGTSLRWAAAVAVAVCCISTLPAARAPACLRQSDMQACGRTAGSNCLLCAFRPRHPAGTPTCRHLANRTPACARFPSSCSKLIGQVQAGQLNAAAAIRAVRALCDSAISSNWHNRRKDAAQAASDLLDEANQLLADFEAGTAAQPAPPPPPPPEPKPEPRRAAQPELPPETFFLSADAVRECLTLNIDSSILVQRRGGWPAGRKRKSEGAGGSGGRVGLGQPAALRGCCAARRGRCSFQPSCQRGCCPHTLACLQGGAGGAAATTRGRRSCSSSWPQC